MEFGAPQYAYGFLPLALLFLFSLIAERRKRKSAEKFEQKGLFPGLVQAEDSKRRKLKLIMFFGALSLSVMALMRPQFGLQMAEVKRSGLDIIIAIDTSKSMLAEDVKPNRLELSKEAVKSLVRKLKGDRIGLIAFSGKAFMLCPLTGDYNGFMLSLNSLDKDTIPRGGTSLSEAIEEAVKGFDKVQKKSKALVIISDGESHEGDAAEAAKAAQKEGLTIFTVGVGTAGGDLISETDQDGQKRFLKDRDGNVVKSCLEEKVLQQIASNSGGDYIRLAASGLPLERLYENRLSAMEKRETERTAKKRPREGFQLSLAFALLLLLADTLTGEGRKRE
ncbi:MAG: VWA domain-containing protein [Nitrospirales bacterium]|nr:VWA domain-containing protein [Nitrospirales bacterium]